MAIKAAQRLEDRKSEAWGLGIIAHAYYQTGSSDQQSACLELANRIWCELSDRDGEQRTLCNLAIAARALGDYAKSISLLGCQIAIAREIDNKVAESIGQLNLGEAREQLGDTGAALVHVKNAHAKALAIGDTRTLALTLYVMGRLYLDRDRLGEAEMHMKQALPLMREIGDRENEAELLIMLSRACRLLGDFFEARFWCEQGLGIGGGIGDWYFETEAAHEHGRVMAALRS